jgi:hypothetical protein
MFGNCVRGCFHMTIGLMMMREKEGSESNGNFSNGVIELVNLF